MLKGQCPICKRTGDLTTENCADGWRSCEYCEAYWHAGTLAQKSGKRYCAIVGGSIEDQHCRGDGAYGLLGLNGSIEDVCRQLAEQMADCDLSGADGDLINDLGEELYLNVTFKIARHHVDCEDLREHDDDARHMSGSIADLLTSAGAQEVFPDFRVSPEMAYLRQPFKGELKERAEKLVKETIALACSFDPQARIQLMFGLLRQLQVMYCG